MADGFKLDRAPVTRPRTPEASEHQAEDMQQVVIEKLTEVKDKIRESLFETIINNIKRHPALFTLGPSGTAITTGIFYPDHANMFGEDTTGLYETLIGSGLSAAIAAFVIFIVVEASKAKPDEY